MKCKFQKTGERHKSGRMLMKCIRCGKEGLAGNGEIHATCGAWPMATEHREWLAIFSAAVGELTGVHYAEYIRWRFRGSKLDELPPGIPKPRIQPKHAGLTETEVAQLLPDESDPTLIGNRIAALTAALGIPPCAGCEKRKEWLNSAHKWLRGE